MLKKIIDIIGWIILLLAFGALGLNSDDKLFGFFFYLIFFIIVFGLVYFYTKKRHRRIEEDTKKSELIHKITGVAILIVALFSPIIAFRKIELPFTPNLLIFFVTAILIVLGTIAVILINKGKIMTLLGYILLIVLSSVPAIFATTYFDQFFPNSYNALGTSYWAIVAISVFSWWGISEYKTQT